MPPAPYREPVAPDPSSPEAATGELGALLSSHAPAPFLPSLVRPGAVAAVVIAVGVIIDVCGGSAMAFALPIAAAAFVALSRSAFRMRRTAVALHAGGLVVSRRGASRSLAFADVDEVWFEIDPFHSEAGAYLRCLRLVAFGGETYAIPLGVQGGARIATAVLDAWARVPSPCTSLPAVPGCGAGQRRGVLSELPPAERAHPAARRRDRQRLEHRFAPPERGARHDRHQPARLSVHRRRGARALRAGREQHPDGGRGRSRQDHQHRDPAHRRRRRRAHHRDRRDQDGPRHVHALPPGGELVGAGRHRAARPRLQQHHQPDLLRVPEPRPASTCRRAATRSS